MVGRSRGNCRETVKYMWNISPKRRLNYERLHQAFATWELGSLYFTCWYNDLCLDRPPELIAKSIIDLALTLKSESHDVSVSNIIVRNDSDTLNKKGWEVNSILTELCKEKNIYLIENTKKIKPQHLKKGKLHLNQKGSRLLSHIFKRN